MKTTEKIELAKKLHPARFPGMSGKMIALTGYLLGEQFTEPGMASVTVTSDGGVIAMHTGDCGYNDFIGAVSDLRRNFARLFDCSGLNQSELQAARAKFQERFGVKLATA